MQRVRRDEIVEPVAAHAAQHVRRERRLELEHAGRASGAQHLVDLLVVERHSASRSTTVARALLDRHERVVDDRERREAEEVHLEHARLLEAVHVVLADDDLTRRRPSPRPSTTACRPARSRRPAPAR